MLINPQDYQIDGTVSVGRIFLSDMASQIAIENISMLSCYTYRHNPTKANHLTQPDVVRSLERSLNLNADVWEELSKY